MSFFQSYRATEGLDRFPPNLQFFVWREAHKSLKNSDPIYRAQCRKFAVKIIVATVIFTFIVIVPDYLPFYGIIPRFSATNAEPNLFLWEMVLPGIIALIATAIFVPYLLVVSFREQKWRNTIIANEIKKQPVVA